MFLPNLSVERRYLAMELPRQATAGPLVVIITRQPSIACLSRTGWRSGSIDTLNALCSDR